MTSADWFPLPTGAEAMQVWALALLLSVPSVLVVMLVASWFREKRDD